MNTTTNNKKEVLEFLERSSGFYPLRYLQKKLPGISIDELAAILAEAHAEGLVLKSLAGDYATAAVEIREGTISRIMPSGFGFISNGTLDDDFAPASQLGLLLPGDLVYYAVPPASSGKKSSAHVLALVKRPRSWWLGTVTSLAPARVEWDESFGPELRVSEFPDNVDVGDTVLVDVAEDAPCSAVLHGLFVRSLGKRGRPGFDTDYAIAKWGIPYVFSAEAREEAARKGLPSASFERKDLRHLPLVTIDGESTRDFDDAVYAERAGDEYTLWVAIADVSHYVEAGGVLDQEAYMRGTSVYFPERVIPMLPEVLSNGLCSLNPDEDRAALVCEMRISRTGELRSYLFYSALVRSQGRLTYSGVSWLLSGETVTCDKQLLKTLQTLDELHVLLRGRRQEKGVLQFRSREPRLVYRQGEITDIHWFETTRAHGIVEECMLVANRSAAEYLTQHTEHAVYRHHTAPDPEKWAEAGRLLAQEGIVLAETPTLAALAAATDAIRAHPDASVLEEVVRGLLVPASYDARNASHFSLGFDAYAHFTSPIRRYADLQVHRLIKNTFARSPSGGNRDLEEVVSQCALSAHRAIKATRDVWTLIKRRHLAKCLGITVVGKVLRGSPKGLTVVLVDWECTAWLPASSLLNEGCEWNAFRELWEFDGLVFRTGTCLELKLIESSDIGVGVCLAGMLAA